MPLPNVLMTDVVRSTQQGDSHGGAYLVNLETGSHDKVLDWNTMDIDWDGRGQGRGLRGIAYTDDRIYIAASDELYVFDTSLSIIASHRCNWLRHCHEIVRDSQYIYLTSTTYDSILAFDIEADRFVRAWHVSADVDRASNTATLAAVPFDPSADDGAPDTPPPDDKLHINSVWRAGGDTYFSGTRLPGLLRIRGGLDDPKLTIEQWAPLPVWTHNARPLTPNHVVYNSTDSDSVIIADRSGRTLRTHKAVQYPLEELLRADIPQDHARQGFLRGLCTTPNGLLIVGSSPSTVTAYHPRQGIVASVNLTMDVRHCPHGLEIWPF